MPLCPVCTSYWTCLPELLGLCVFEVWAAMHLCMHGHVALFAKEQVQVLIYFWMLIKNSLFFNIVSWILWILRLPLLIFCGRLGRERRVVQGGGALVFAVCASYLSWRDGAGGDKNQTLRLSQVPKLCSIAALASGGKKPHRSLQHTGPLWLLLARTHTLCTVLFLCVQKHSSDMVVNRQLTATCARIWIAFVHSYTLRFLPVTVVNPLVMIICHNWLI